MPSGLSDYAENKLLGYYFGSVSASLPATYYVGLWTATLVDASTGSTAGEPSGGAYARVAVTNDGSNFDAPAGGATANTLLIAFPMATASWGTITYVGICDAASAGNLIAYGSLTTPAAVAIYDTVLFQPGELDITIT